MKDRVGFSPVIDIPAVLAKGMGPRLHWFPEKVQPSKLASVMVGMANTDGGSVFLGVAPRSTHIQGVKDTTRALDIIFQAALLPDPPLVLPMPQVYSVNRLQVMWITVPSGLPHVYCLDGRYLGREGAYTGPLPARRLRQMLVERGMVHFESQVPPDITLDDLDQQKVAAYLKALDFHGSEAPEEVLLRRGCLRYASNGEGVNDSVKNLRPTYAAVLLFGKHPQQWLPNATILAARFSGTTLADTFIKQDISGTLPDQLRQAEVFVRENVRRVVHLVGLERQEMSEYPLEAVRELLVNAVAHRDYNLQGDSVHLNIFSDRIEVQSPGGLPGPVNLENLLEARFSRNAVTAQVLSDLGFVERMGYGLNRVVDVMRRNGKRPPQFNEGAGTFRVVLHGADQSWRDGEPTLDPDTYGQLELNPRQQKALAFLIQKRRITNRDYQALCLEVHSETLRRDLADLVKRGLVIKVGVKRATYYILKK
jgi:ATP-dependent DNA helicase RecG